MGDALSQAVAVTEAGILFGDTPLLLLQKVGGHVDRAASERALALLSVAEGRRLEASSVLPALEAAAAHWSRGDRALANLRLAFAQLPRRADPLDRARVGAAAFLLDNGFSPDDLLAALWPESKPATLEKYDANEARIPAGHGRVSGEWTFGYGPFSFHGQSTAPQRIVVATGKKPSPEEELLYEEHRIAGQTTTEEQFAHGGINPLESTPAAPPQAQVAKINEVIGSISTSLPPGRGPLYGTSFHTEMKLRLNALGDPKIHAEVSYMNGEPTNYGVRGSIRADIVIGTPKEPLAVFDLKTGGAKLGRPQITLYRLHLPKRFNFSIKELRP